MVFMGKRILLVDDEADIRAIYKKIIETGGYEVATAKSGVEALEKMSTFKPHLVVLDIMMPEMDGWEVAQRIRKKNNELPIIMLTIKGEIEDKVKSVEEAGANRHLTKPVERSVLISSIQALLDEL